MFWVVVYLLCVPLNYCLAYLANDHVGDVNDPDIKHGIFLLSILGFFGSALIVGAFLHGVIRGLSNKLFK